MIEVSPAHKTLISKWNSIRQTIPDVYLASAHENHIMMQGIEKLFIGDMDITSQWHRPEYIGKPCNRYEIDILNGVAKSNLVICFYPYGDSGMLQEMSYAIANQIPVLYVVPKYVDEHPLMCDSFYSGPTYDFNTPQFLEQIHICNWNGGILINSLQKIYQVLDLNY
jgi:hypothetical protein